MIMLYTYNEIEGWELAAWMTFPQHTKLLVEWKKKQFLHYL